MREAGCVVSKDNEVLFWHLPLDRSGGALPDSRTLWDVLWEAHQRGHLLGFAHSHPGSGLPQASYEDISTFIAIERALGCKLVWWIASADRFVQYDSHMKVTESGRLDYAFTGRAFAPGVVPEPAWLPELRRHSNY